MHLQVNVFSDKEEIYILQFLPRTAGLNVFMKIFQGFMSELNIRFSKFSRKRY